MTEKDMSLIHYLGYDGIYAELKRNIAPIINLIARNSITAKDILCTYDSYKQYEVESLEKLIATARQLYENRNIKLHSVYVMTDFDTFMEFVSSNNYYHDDPLLISEIDKRTRLVSPFDIPIILENGIHLAGDCQKALLPNEPSRTIRFRNISINNHFSLASTLMYAHEIAHTQTESIPGYTKNLVNREVVSVFLEKAFALDLDPSGELLRLIEKGRFLTDIIESRNLFNSRLISNTSFKRYQDALNASHFLGTLLGTALFDKYQHESAENQANYFEDVQDIFNGEMMVEDFLRKRRISMNEATNASIISRHL